MSDRRLSHRDVHVARAAAREQTDDRKPLDIGVLNEHLGYFIRRLQVWVFQDFIRTLAPVDIRPAQYSVLVVIAANPGLSQSDLADRLGIERARLVRVLDKLEKRGLTQRLASPTDRRSHALRLTNNLNTKPTTAYVIATESLRALISAAAAAIYPSSRV